MSVRDRGAAERVSDQENVLDALLHEREGLLTVLDRVVALNGTARLIRDVVGVHAGFVADLETPDVAVIRWLAGNRTDSLQNLAVPLGQGVGGQVVALGKPVRVSDYVTAPTITHQFDQQVRGEGLSALMAVPIIDPTGSRIVAVAYAALRESADFGDDAVQRLENVAAQAARALHLATLADSTKDRAVSGERQRMQAALHDSVGAMLFSIGAQVRDLHTSISDNPGLAERLHRLERDVSAASSALRESLLALSESTPERALPVELAEHCRSFEARSGVTARFVQLGSLRPLDVERNALLVSVVREGLLNVEKHTRAYTVVVSLSASNDGVQVVVADDGVPTASDEAPVGSGMGVRALAERAARLGGRVSLVRDDDGGTTLRAWLPDVEKRDPI
ncbi:GAF domain-containing protein [Actinokineospora sp.]|uniref:GAF domain-containing protein n=1 Tax=Actinokineospora sp. TaxID=1872133 RepID=UPI004037BB59